MSLAGATVSVSISINTIKPQLKFWKQIKINTIRPQLKFWKQIKSSACMVVLAVQIKSVYMQLLAIALHHAITDDSIGSERTVSGSLQQPVASSASLSLSLSLKN